MYVRQSIAVLGESSVYDFESKTVRFESQVVLEESFAHDFESQTVRRGLEVYVDRFSAAHFQSKRDGKDRFSAYQEEFIEDDSRFKDEHFRLQTYRAETKNAHLELKP